MKLNKFEKVYLKIINEMKESKRTICIESQWNDKQEQEQFKNEVEKYNVIAKFHDGGDYYSSWELTGSDDSLIQVIINHWNSTKELALLFLEGKIGDEELDKGY